MTSNDNGEVNNNSSQNQQSKATNGVLQKKCAGSMHQSLNTLRIKSNRYNNSNMVLKRHRSIDSAAGMC